MSDSSEGRVVPIWMLVLCWLVALPMIIDPEYWLEIKLPVFVSFLVLTIVALRQRPAA